MTNLVQQWRDYVEAQRNQHAFLSKLNVILVKNTFKISALLEDKCDDESIDFDYWVKSFFTGHNYELEPNGITLVASGYRTYNDEDAEYNSYTHDIDERWLSETNTFADVIVQEIFEEILKDVKLSEEMTRQQEIKRLKQEIEYKQQKLKELEG